MKNFKIGLQMYSVRNYLAKDFEGTVRAVAEAGYEYAEFAGYYGGLGGTEMKELLDKYGMKSISVHAGQELYSDCVKAFDFYKGFGVRYVVIPWYDRNRMPGSEYWSETKNSFSELAAKARENGMSLLYHNHDFEFASKIDGKYPYDILFEELNGLLDPQPDTCWMNYGGVNPSEYLRKYGNRINVVHLKDFVCTKLGGGPVYSLIGKDDTAEKPSRSDTGFKMVPLGQGCQDWESIIGACDEIGAEYLIVEQDDFVDIDPLDGVAQSRRYLKEKFGI